MAWRFRKSISLGKGLRLNITKKGVGVSAGIPGFRMGVGADGKMRRTVSIPGTGIHNTKVVTAKKPATPRMVCTACGNVLRKKDKYCSYCGRKV